MDVGERRLARETGHRRLPASVTDEPLIITMTTYLDIVDVLEGHLDGRSIELHLGPKLKKADADGAIRNIKEFVAARGGSVERVSDRHYLIRVRRFDDEPKRNSDIIEELQERDIQDFPGREEYPPAAETPSELEEIRIALAGLAKAQELVQLRVERAREAGATWAQIGEVVGTSGQAAYLKWDPRGRETNRRAAARRRQRPDDQP